MGIRKEKKDDQKNKLYKEWFWGSHYDIGALEEHFGQMAKKGLMLCSVKGMFYCYERCEPKTARFCVDCFDKATNFDTRAERETLEYIEYCEEADWHYICTNGRLQYFCTEKADAVPIRTDSDTAFRSLTRNTLKANAIAWFVLPFIYLFTIAAWLFRADNYYTFLNLTAGGMWQNVMLFYVVYILIALTGVTRFLIFYFRNKKRARQGEALRYYSGKSTKLYGRSIAAAAMLALSAFMAGALYAAASLEFVYITIGAFAVVILISFIICKALYSAKATRGFNIAMTIVASVAALYVCLGIMTLVTLVSNRNSGKIVIDGEVCYYSSDKLPVTMEELGVEAAADEYLYEETCAAVSRGFLASLHEYEDFYVKKDGDVLAQYSIDIFKTKNARIQKQYEEQLKKMAGGDFTQLDYEGAGECSVYQIGDSLYMRYLRFEDCQVLVESSWEIDDAQLERLITAYGL